jgi:Flp pilus assembly protein TadG
METVKNERGTVLIFATVLIVLLMIMVAMGLDTGHLVYVRAQGQAAVDAAALAAASAIPTGDDNEVKSRAAAFDTKNQYVGNTTNPITGANVTYVQYSSSNGTITTSGVNVVNANGVRVAMESTNPYTGAAPGTSISAPVFLMPLLRLFGQTADATEQVSVSAVAAIKAMTGLPIAIEQSRCTAPNPQRLLQTSSPRDNSGYTTYTISDTSAAEITALLRGAPTCGLPSTGIGFPTELNNGQISSVYNDFANVFRADPGKCYMIPVVRNSSNWNQQETIIDFAKFCPDPTNPVVQHGSDKYIQGTVTCGQNPYTITNVKCYTSALVRDARSGM